MARRNYSNTAVPQILQTSVSTTDTVFTVSSTASYPSTANPFLLSIDRGLSNEEVCLCTATSTTTFTVIRGYDGTTAATHTGATALIEHSSSAMDVAEPNAFVNTMTTSGDLLYQSSSGAARLPIGTAGQIMQIPATGAALPSWRTVPQPTVTSGIMDAASPIFAPSGYFATVSAAGRPRCAVTIPSTGKVAVEWGFVGGVNAFGSTGGDLYLAVGWSTSGTVAGAWSGSGGSGSVGSGGSNYQVVCAALIDGDGGLGFFRDLNGEVLLTGLPAGSYWFYLLWSPVGASAICPASTRGAAQNGTYIRASTQPW